MQPVLSQSIFSSHKHTLFCLNLSFSSPLFEIKLFEIKFFEFEILVFEVVSYSQLNHHNQVQPNLYGKQFSNLNISQITRAVKLFPWLPDLKKNWGKNLLEMKLLVSLFAVEHFVSVVPLFILTSQIGKRNIFLDNFFPQVSISAKLHFLLNRFPKRGSSINYFTQTGFPCYSTGLCSKKICMWIVKPKEGNTLCNTSIAKFWFFM